MTRALCTPTTDIWQGHVEHDNIGGVPTGTLDGRKSIRNGSYNKTFALKVSADVLARPLNQ
jgi:hypothetical protein